MKWFRPTPQEVYKNIDALFTKEAIDWDLIACHLPDMLQVAQSIRAGRISPSTILRKLGTASRKNKLYFAFRELGRVIRTIFLLEYIGDEDLRSIIQAAQNKCEGFNQFAQWIYFGPPGSRRDRGHDRRGRLEPDGRRGRADGETSWPAPPAGTDDPPSSSVQRKQ